VCLRPLNLESVQPETSKAFHHHECLCHNGWPRRRCLRRAKSALDSFGICGGGTHTRPRQTRRDPSMKLTPGARTSLRPFPTLESTSLCNDVSCGCSLRRAQLEKFQKHGSEVQLLGTIKDVENPHPSRRRVRHPPATATPGSEHPPFPEAGKSGAPRRRGSVVQNPEFWSLIYLRRAHQ
jgi:hypothetical protein